MFWKSVREEPRSNFCTYKYVISRNAKPLKGYVPDPLGTVLPKTGSAIFAQDRRREVGESAQTLHRGAQGRAQGD